MSRGLKIAITVLNFMGWVLILASACYNQNKVGRKALNYPLDWWGGLQNGGTPSPIMANAASNWPAAPGGRALSFLWWITSFQLFGILLSAAAHFKPSLRIGSAALLAVLTASTFAYTYDVYSDSLGIFALTHNSSLDSFVPTKDNMPGRLYSFYKGLAILLAGLIVCDIMNALTVLMLPMDDEASTRRNAGEPKPGDIIV